MKFAIYLEWTHKMKSLIATSLFLSNLCQLMLGVEGRYGSRPVGIPEPCTRAPHLHTSSMAIFLQSSVERIASRACWNLLWKVYSVDQRSIKSVLKEVL